MKMCILELYKRKFASEIQIELCQVKKMAENKEICKKYMTLCYDETTAAFIS